MGHILGIPVAPDILWPAANHSMFFGLTAVLVYTSRSLQAIGLQRLREARKLSADYANCRLAIEECKRRRREFVPAPEPDSWLDLGINWYLWIRWGVLIMLFFLFYVYLPSFILALIRMTGFTNAAIVSNSRPAFHLRGSAQRHNCQFLLGIMNWLQRTGTYGYTPLARVVIGSLTGVAGVAFCVVLM